MIMFIGFFFKICNRQHPAQKYSSIAWIVWKLWCVVPLAMPYWLPWASLPRRYDIYKDIYYDLENYFIVIGWLAAQLKLGC